jgi:hypothetical protein
MVHQMRLWQEKTKVSNVGFALAAVIPEQSEGIFQASSRHTWMHRSHLIDFGARISPPYPLPARNRLATDPENQKNLRP